MTTGAVVDLVVAATLVLAAVGGAARGLGRTVAGVAGALLGLLVAAVLAPHLGAWGDAGSHRLVVAVSGVALIVLGAAVGLAAGSLWRGLLTRLRLGWVDTAGGLVAGLVLASMLWTLAAPNLAILGVPQLSEGVQRSRVLGAVTALAPSSLREGRALSQLLERTEPWVAEVVGAPVTPPTLPDGGLTAEGEQALSSVVKVSGPAPDCGATVSGSGVVVAPDRVMTNAHVVAGVDRPVVRAPGELPAPGQVVYVDEANDVAIVATSGLAAPPLDLLPQVADGTKGVVAGYPGGGPLRVGAAEVLSQQRSAVRTETSSAVRPVAVLAADVDQGNSGGPVLDRRGRVIGLVFAQSATTADVGYAVPLPVIRPVAQESARLSAPVATGSCRVPS